MTAERQERNAWRRGIALIGLIAALVLHCDAVPAATTERIVVNRHTGLAIGGYDPVAYFTDAEAKLGKPEFEVSEGGAVWRFCNAANQAFFLARPDVYAPQFGGYDPLDVARGVPVAGNPRIWLVVGKRLYLFSRNDSRDAFAADPVQYLQDAVHRWPELLAMLAE
jgi:YHS domain-containing protein